MSEKHSGTCFCGAVGVEVTGAPEAMGYCHCESCRSWSAGPVNAFTLWKPENVKVTKGAEFVSHYKKTDMSDRQFCSQCGGHLAHEDGQGKVPRADTDPRATGNQAQLVALTGGAGHGDGRHDALGLTGVVAHEVDGLAHLAHGIAPGLKSLFDQQRTEARHLFLQRISRAAQYGGTF